MPDNLGELSAIMDMNNSIKQLVRKYENVRNLGRNRTLEDLKNYSDSLTELENGIKKKRNDITPETKED